jgi:acetyl-CoA carboxylase biotin carboxyl carrier protein
MNQLTPQDLVRIIELVESTASIQSFHLRHGELEVFLAKQGNGAIAPPPRTNGPEAPGSAGAPALPAQSSVSAPVPPQPVQATRDTAESAQEIPAGAHVVKSPTVGTFYAAKEPGAEPFVTVGQKIKAGTTLCIIEVMKLMNTVQSPVDGVVTRVLVADAAAVEFGQLLMVIEPA